MSSILEQLSPKQRRGSKPRCHAMTHGDPKQVAQRLTQLISPWGLVNSDDSWMPQGFVSLEEAQLHNAPRLLNVVPHGQALRAWWLAVDGARSMTPNFDIASTCTVGGRKGLLLIEAKAHSEELNKETAGKTLKAGASVDSRKNHDRIGQSIAEASGALTTATGLTWCLSRDSHYQMGNRFAWSWKLTTRGVPVILVYLSFLGADEMHDRGIPFVLHEDWERLVRGHSANQIPADAWERRWEIDGVPLIPLIRSVEADLPKGLEGA